MTVGYHDVLVVFWRRRSYPPDLRAVFLLPTLSVLCCQFRTIPAMQPRAQIPSLSEPWQTATTLTCFGVPGFTAAQDGFAASDPYPTSITAWNSILTRPCWLFKLQARDGSHESRVPASHDETWVSWEPYHAFQDVSTDGTGVLNYERVEMAVWSLRLAGNQRNICRSRLQASRKGTRAFSWLLDGFLDGPVHVPREKRACYPWYRWISQ